LALGLGIPWFSDVNYSINRPISQQKEDPGKKPLSRVFFDRLNY